MWFYIWSDEDAETDYYRHTWVVQNLQQLKGTKSRSSSKSRFLSVILNLSITRFGIVGQFSRHPKVSV